MLDRRQSVGPERSVDAEHGAFMGQPEATHAPGDERFSGDEPYFNFFFWRETLGLKIVTLFAPADIASRAVAN